MREIRTRPKARERKHADTLPKQAVKTLQQQALRRKMMKRELDKDVELRDTPVQETVQKFETSAEKATRLSSRTAFRVGKQAAKERFDRRNSPHTHKEDVHFDDSPIQPESQPMVRAKQQFRRMKYKKRFQQAQERKQDQSQREAAVSAEIHHEVHTTTDALDIASSGTPRSAGRSGTPKQNALSKQTEPVRRSALSGAFPATEPERKNERRDRHFRSQSTAARPVQSNPNNPARLLNRQAQRRAQERAMQESIQKRVRTAKNTARRTEQVKQAALRAGKAIVRAAVGLLGGAGALIALVLVIGGAAAVIGTPPLTCFGLAMTATHNRFHRRSCRSMTNSPQKSARYRQSILLTAS